MSNICIICGFAAVVGFVGVMSVCTFTCLVSFGCVLVMAYGRAKEPRGPFLWEGRPFIQGAATQCPATPEQYSADQV